MKTNIFSFAAFPAVLAFAGCMGVGPNTQEGAVAGGALGALAGAVIGHNSGGGNGLAGALLGGTAGALAGGTLGNSADHQSGTIYADQPFVADPSVDISSAPPPPPPRDEIIVPAPSPGACWVGGYWSYSGRAYRWIPGHWEMPPPHAHVFVAPHWERRARVYRFMPGYWR